MKNFLLLAAVFSCHVAVAKVEAAQHAPEFKPETNYIVVMYSKSEAEAVQREVGYLPKRHLTPPGSTQVWAAFDSKSPNAERFSKLSVNAYVVSRSRFAYVLKDCTENPTTDYEAKPFCAPQFLELAEVIND